MPNKKDKQFNLNSKPKPKFLYLPLAISLLRLPLLPILVFCLNQGFTILAYALFVFVLFTDIADGYAAKKLKADTRIGTHFDATIDFLFIAGMFVDFTIKGFYPPWILLLISTMYIQFILTSVSLKLTYDPIGKYYGSLLYGAVGLTLLFQGDLIYTIVSAGIVFTTFTSLLSRLVHIIKIRSRLHNKN